MFGMGTQMLKVVGAEHETRDITTLVTRTLLRRAFGAGLWLDLQESPILRIQTRGLGRNESDDAVWKLLFHGHWVGSWKALLQMRQF